ncbi:MAG: hypothetical protein HQ512_15675 [Rhodospirillales bacterium]|nr:hypothetical protein [Rhodospirillales bacterium]
MAKKKNLKTQKDAKKGDGPEGLMRSLFERMEAEADAEALNDNVITPFIAALEEVCEARGYQLNIYGEKSNIVFSGSEADAEAIYKMVEDYLTAKEGD